MHRIDAAAHVAEYAAACRRGHVPPGATPVVVLMLTRNNAAYWRNTFGTVYDTIHQTWPQGVQWFILENDSTDDTVAVLHAWAAAKHNLQVSSAHLPATQPLVPRCNERTQRLAWLRNALLGWAWPALGPATQVVLLDTSVTFTTATLRVLSALVHTRQVSMACANTCERDHPTHYYDTYSLGQTTCLWRECRRCRGPTSCQYRRPTDWVRVPSAFGGLALLLGSALPGPWWQASHNECEHVSFCAQLPGPVGIALAAPAVWTAQ